MREKMGNKIIGIGFILGAIGFIASELGYLDNFNITTIILGIVFAGAAVGGLMNKNYNQAIYCGGFFYYFTQDTLGFPELSMWVILVSATLVAIGASFLGGTTGKKQMNGNSSSNGGGSQWNQSTNSHESINTIFGDTEKFLNTQQLESVKAQSVFGDVKIYFEEAKIRGNQAVVDVEIVFGEVMLFVPRNWKVDCRVNTVFGDCTIRGHQEVEEKTLVVNGHVIFGELQILYV